jgi:cyclopropane-fatty-acyl-phospholipid synthase
VTLTADGPTQTQVRTGPWTEIAPARRVPVHAAIARWLFRRAVGRLPIRVLLPDGTIWGGGGPTDPAMSICNERAFFRRLGADALIGFGEAYMAQDWTAEEPAAVLTPLAACMAVHVPKWMQRLRGVYVRRQPRIDDNTRRGARRNIARHYDLSNDLFALFLDQSMTYSSAWFEPGDTLEDAQARKIDRLLDAANVGAGTRVLEIGTGWGSLAIRAARRGAAVRTITISVQQAELARQRAEEAGVSDRVVVELCDYRDAEGTYDAVLSVEMIEAVGEDYWPTFFRSLDRLLAPGGSIGLQAIVLGHERMLATRYQYTWVHKYIFPGGALPSIRAIEEILDADTELRITQVTPIGQHYATTLHQWRDRFTSGRGGVEALGFDASFQRMWEFYLVYCEAGFASGYLDVTQLLIQRSV